MRLIAELTDLSEHEVQFLFEEQYNYITPDGKSIYIIEGKAKIPTITSTSAQNTTDEEWYRTWRAEQAIHQRIAHRIKLMYLFKEGAIAMVASSLYHANKDAIEPNSSIRDMHDVETGIYTLTGAEAEYLHNFLEEQESPFTPSYVQSTYENFE